MTRRLGATCVAVLVASLPPVLQAWAAGAPGSLAAEVEAVATGYHQDPRRLDGLRAKLESVVRAEPAAEHLLALARVSFLWGDVRARARAQKLEAYDEGRQAGRRAVELLPRSAAAHFWYAVNTARWGQVNGVLRSLFLLPEVRREIDTIIEIDPRFSAVYALAGNVLYEVPGLLGGDLDRAEAMFRTGLRLDPHFTAMRVGLARTLIKQGRRDEARRELSTVLEARRPTNLADWTIKDAPEARALLASLGSGS